MTDAVGTSTEVVGPDPCDGHRSVAAGDLSGNTAYSA